MGKSSVVGLWGVVTILGMGAGLAAAAERGANPANAHAGSQDRALAVNAASAFAGFELVSLAPSSRDPLLARDGAAVFAAAEPLARVPAGGRTEEWRGIDWAQNPFLTTQDAVAVSMWGDMPFRFLQDEQSAAAGGFPQSIASTAVGGDAGSIPDALIAAVLALIGLVAIARRRSDQP